MGLSPHAQARMQQRGIRPEAVEQSPENGWRFFLFVRENKEVAYCALGPATKISIEGDRPMSVHWKLEIALPMELFRSFSVLRA